MPALALAAQGARGQATQTTLAAETLDRAGRTKTTLAVAVTGEDGRPAQGAVAIRDHGRDVAGVALNAEGQAKVDLDLAGGDHNLRAVYTGDATHQRSVSALTGVHALNNTGAPDFQISIVPATLSLTAGQAGTVIASITPENASSLTGPMFVTLSCSGNPDESSCTFTPETVEILQNAVAPVTSSMVFQTQIATTLLHRPERNRSANPVAWAFLLPGALAFAGLAWGGRRRRWLSRVSLMALVGLVTMLGTTGCNPLYRYLNHSPIPSPATPSGSYTIHVTAQSNNGVTATTHYTTLALTVK
jgi:hypothetical protein